MQSIPTLLAELTEILKFKQLKLSTAESCTGGLIAQTLTALPGSSAWFDCGWVTYSNDSKEKLLKVPQRLIQTHGAVSEPVAKAMAVGALTLSLADFAISVTGIAGPEGGTSEKPVGTVWIGLAKQDEVLAQHFCWKLPSRNEIREQSCAQALKMLIEFCS